MYTVTLYYKAINYNFFDGTMKAFSGDGMTIEIASKEAYEKAQQWLDNQSAYDKLDFDGTDWYRWG